jgi:hypothetical protein
MYVDVFGGMVRIINKINRFQVRFAYQWEYERAVSALLKANCNVLLLDVKTLVSSCDLVIIPRYPRKRLKIDLTCHSYDSNSDIHSSQASDNVEQVGADSIIEIQI